MENIDMRDREVVFGEGACPVSLVQITILLPRAVDELKPASADTDTTGFSVLKAVIRICHRLYPQITDERIKIPARYG